MEPAVDSCVFRLLHLPSDPYVDAGCDLHTFVWNVNKAVPDKCLQGGGGIVDAKSRFWKVSLLYATCCMSWVVHPFLSFCFSENVVFLVQSAMFTELLSLSFFSNVFHAQWVYCEPKRSITSAVLSAQWWYTSGPGAAAVKRQAISILAWQL